MPKDGGEKHMQEDITIKQSRFKSEKQLLGLYKQAEVALVASIFCAAILAYILSDVVALDRLVLWGQIVGGVAMLRYIAIYAFRNNTATEQTAGSWYFVFVVTLALSGLSWGVAPLLFAPTIGTIYGAIAILIIMGLVSGAAAAFAGDRVAFAAFAGPAVLLPVVHFLTYGNDITQKFAVVMLLYLAFLLLSTERAFQMRLKEFNLQLEREELSRELREEKEKFESLASELDAHVQTRTEQLTELNEKLQSEVFERNEAAQSAKREKLKFTAAFENAPVGMLIAYRATGEIVKANNAICDLLGYQADEMTKMRLVSLLCPSERASGDSQDLFESNSTAERRFVHRRGHIVWGRTSIGTMSEVESTAGYLVIQIQDLSELKSAHDFISSQGGAFGTAFEATPIATAIIDSCGRLNRVNPRMRMLLDLAHGEVTDLALGTLVDSDDRVTTKLADFFSGRAAHVEADVTLFKNLQNESPATVTLARIGEGNSPTTFGILHIEIAKPELVSQARDGESNNVVPLERRA
ncbi:MAG: PAS domain S-box protein [Pseudomonadota bacterium]